jgi:hypothetical protein
MARSSGEIAADILLNPPMLIMSAGMVVMLFLVLRAAFARAPVTKDGLTDDGGRLIRVKATFTGLRAMPSLFAIASNSANPLLIIHPSEIEYRVLRKRRRPIADIEQVDVRTAWRTVNIVIHFKGEQVNFAANVGTLLAARSTLALFPASTPMTAAAAMLVREPA